METLFDQLRARVEEARVSVEIAKEDLADAERVLDIFERALQEEARKRGLIGKESASSGGPGTPTSGGGADSVDGDNKTEIVASLVGAVTNVTGLSASDVFGELERRSVAIERQYLHSILYRLKKRGRIAKRDGRYFPPHARGASGGIEGEENGQ